jgi:hypothetical protein
VLFFSLLVVVPLQVGKPPTPASSASHGEFLTASAHARSTLQDVGSFTTELKEGMAARAEMAAAGSSALASLGRDYFAASRESARAQADAAREAARMQADAKRESAQMQSQTTAAIVSRVDGG